MKYIFWEQYNCTKISGLPKLIIMGVKGMSLNHKAALISAPTSLVNKILMEDNVDYQFIDENHLSDNVDISSDDVLILPCLRPNDAVLHKYNPKIIIWQIYPSACFKSVFQKILGNIHLRIVSRHNAFVSMDEGCMHTINQELYLRIKGTIIPMPIDHVNYVYDVKSHTNQSTIKISYVGRAVDWKIYAVRKLMKDISKFIDKQFEIHIITDNSSYFSDSITDLLTENIKVTFYENTYGRQMLNIISKMTIHLAMGISTLEGAALGVPTLTAPSNHREIPDYYKFHWFFEDLDKYASAPVDYDYVKRIGHSIDDIIASICNANTLQELSNKCHKAASEFSLETISEQIHNVNTSLHLKNIHYLTGYYWKFHIKHKKVWKNLIF